MSLINQMLKDLERRNASEDEIKPVSGEVRVAQAPASPSQWPRVALWTFLLGATLVSAWWNLKPGPTPAAVVVTQIERPAVVVIPPAPVSPAEVAAEVIPSVPAGTQEPVSATAPATAEIPAPVLLPRLPGLSTELKTVPVNPTPAVDPLPASEKKTEVAPAVAPVRTVTEVTEEKPKKTKRAAKTGTGSAASSLKVVNPLQSSENLYKQSVTLLQQGRVAEARDALVQSLAENPANHNARQLLVGLLVDNKRSGEALALLQEGVRIAPDQNGFVMALARLQVESGERKTAMTTLEQGAKYAADDAEYHGFYAALLQRETRHDEAVTAYLTALRGDPANTSWLVGVGISLQALGKNGDAREAFERARQTGRLSQELTTFVEQRLAQLKGK